MNCENCMGKFDKETMEDALLNWNEKDFIKYIKTHFSFDSHSGGLRKKVEYLRSLDAVVLKTVLTRIKGIEKIHENKYILFFIGGLTAATTSAITSFSIALPVAPVKALPGIIASVCAILILIVLKKAFSKDNYIVALMLSFRELLEQALAAKKNDEK